MAYYIPSICGRVSCRKPAFNLTGKELCLHPTFYKRFIDDGFGIWDHGEESLKAFCAHANSIDPNIKVELRWNRREIVSGYHCIEGKGLLKDGPIQKTN